MIRRHITERFLESLQDTPAVFLQGARQTGKSTLVKALAGSEYEAEYVTLDDATALAAAQADPPGFLAGFSSPVIIDEVQRVPSLLPAIKLAIDQERKPGRFILTGSANVLALPKMSESLAGRMELHTLWPFSQGEIEGRKETFIEVVFKKRLALPKASEISAPEIRDRMLVGGFPEVVERKKEERRQAWFGAYTTTILQRDVRDMANVNSLAEFPRLLNLLAARVGQLLNYSDLAQAMSMPQTTLKRYLALLQATFLIKTLPPWFSNIGKRLVKSPKLLVCDSGLIASLLGLNRRRLESDTEMAGRLWENFVAMELVKQATWSPVRPALYHYRTHSQREVDIVLENASGDIVGIEVKSSATVKADHFKGLKDLADSAGSRFCRGIVLYAGAQTTPFGKNLHAVPVGSLWG